MTVESPPQTVKSEPVSTLQEIGKSTIRLSIEGMTCASCVSRVEAALQSADPDAQVRVNLATEQATISSSDTSIEPFIQAIQNAGYGAKAVESQSRKESHLERKRTLNAWLRRLIVGVGLCLPIMALSMWVSFDGSEHVVFILATVVQIYVGAPFYSAAFKAARHGSTTMDTLIVLGASAAYLFSVYSLFGPAAPLYFEGAAMILTFICIGKYLEIHARGAAANAVESLLDLTPPKARRIVESGEQEVDVEQIKPGDVVRVLPSEAVPLDGTITNGRSTIDESMITGESVPVEKSANDEVVGGTVNLTSVIDVEVSHIGSDAVLQRIVDFVRRAQESKADVQRLADRVSTVFVPIIIAIAALTCTGWLVYAPGDVSTAIINAVSVLIIACPCALGLATPTAVMAGAAKGAREGVLIKEAHTLEQAGRLTDFIFDKTGTLTQGKPKIVEVFNVEDNNWLRAAASVETASRHPLAQAIVQYANEKQIDISQPNNVSEHSGGGITAEVDSNSIHIGSIAFLQKNQIDASSLSEWCGRSAKQGRTIVACAVNQRAVGALALLDTLRPSSKAAVERLQTIGLRIHLLSGDKTEAVEAIAQELGISHTFAEVKPTDKADVVKEMQREGRVVAMAGDGVNDAPALSQADVGVAMGGGADIAKESGDIVLIGDDPMKAAYAIQLSRAALAKIKQNLFWAFFYNICAVPAAALGYLTPMVAAGAMAMSSVCVVSNSLLLLRKRV